jgi:hypothetical protein
MIKLKFKLKRKLTRGQLSIGLAVAFAGILAMFGLVFNSALNTREKMKLQTTSDYAALIAADVQRHNLNYIRELNKNIELEWYTLATAIQVPFCDVVIAECATNYACIGPKIASFLASNANIPSEIEASTAGSDACDVACDQYDDKWKSYLIQGYRNLHLAYTSAIGGSLKDANGLAFEKVLDTFLSPTNLPHGLYMEMQKKLGQGFTLAGVRNQYESGGLTNDPNYAYDILQANSEDYLFVPFQETRITPHINYSYVQWTDQALNQHCTPGVPGGVKVNVLPLRVTRDGNYTTHFFTGVTYTPPPSLMDKMINVGVKNPTVGEHFGEEVETVNGKEKLFKRRALGVYARSAAKPYGGTFPTAGTVGSSPDLGGMLSGDFDSILGAFTDPGFGTSGDEFKGSRLFGIADKAEIEEWPIRARGCINQTDADGNVIGCIEYIPEDFLH